MVIPKIIYEDDNFLAINKPAGVLTHQASSVKHQKSRNKTLADWLLKNHPEIKNVGDDPKTRPGIVHRLDKDTSGVMLAARNQKYFEYLKNLFKTGKIKKTYLALVWGKLEPRQGIIKKPIKIKAGSVKRTVWRGKDEREAATEYKVLKYFSYSTSLTIVNKVLYFSLVEVFPKTGRTHQIRIHLASIGHPVVGDLLYGFKTRNHADLYAKLRGKGIEIKRQFLHAQSLEFNIEDGRRIKIEAELPRDLKIIIDELEIKK